MTEEISILPSEYGWVPLVALILLVVAALVRFFLRGAQHALRKHAQIGKNDSPRRASSHLESGIEPQTNAEPADPENSGDAERDVNASITEPSTNNEQRQEGQRRPQHLPTINTQQDEARKKESARHERMRAEKARKTVADIVDEEQQKAELESYIARMAAPVSLGKPAPKPDSQAPEESDESALAHEEDDWTEDLDAGHGSASHFVKSDASPTPILEIAHSPEPVLPVEPKATEAPENIGEPLLEPSAEPKQIPNAAAEENPSGSESVQGDEASTDAGSSPSEDPFPVLDAGRQESPQPKHTKPRGRSLSGPRPDTRPTFDHISDLIDDQMGAAKVDFGPVKNAATTLGSGVKRALSAVKESRSRGWSASTIAWLAVAFFALLFFTILCFSGQVEDDLFSVCQFTIVTLAMGTLSLLRDPLFFYLENLERRGTEGRVRAEALRAGRDILLIILATTISLLAIEMPWNPSFLDISSTFLALEAGSIVLVLLALYFLFQRHGAGPAIGVAVFLLIGIAQYFVREFKDVPIVPTDLLALGTAQAVAGQYTYIIGKSVVRAATLAMISIMSFAFVRPTTCRTRVPRFANLAGNLAAALVFALCFRGFVTGPPMWKDAYGTHVYYWELFDYYESEGFIPTFVTIAQDLPVQEPKDYSEGRAKELTAQYASTWDKEPKLDNRRERASAQFNEIKPSVIVVMNETFADMSLYRNLDAGYDGPQFYRYGLPDSLAHGQLSVSVRGGGTCNTEFEFLTGNSLAWVGSNKYPYSMYDLSDVDNLARQFKSWGYTATAMHPNLSTNWNRDVVFKDMGFDRFVAIDDFTKREDIDFFHNGVPDYLTYQYVLEMLRNDQNPQFVMDITMQNHGGYEVNNIPSPLLTAYKPSSFDDGETNAQLNEYLSCIEASDRALEWFVSQLSALNRPVVLVFFGDHQSGFVNTYNNGLYPNEDGNDISHWIRTYSTDYTIWANYEVAGLENRFLIDPYTDARLSIRLRRDQFDNPEQAEVGRIWGEGDGAKSLWETVGMRYDGIAVRVEETLPVIAEQEGLQADQEVPEDVQMPIEVPEVQQTPFEQANPDMTAVFEPRVENINGVPRLVVSSQMLLDNEARAYLAEWQGRSATWASASDLGAITLDLIGAPLTDFQKAQLELRKTVKAINGFSYLGNDNKWYSLDETSGYTSTLEDFKLIDYLNFGSKVQK